MTPPIFKTAAELQAYLQPFRAGRIALVPTMGALHEGHLELVRRAAEAADHVVVYIFVNPTQFAPHEDFNTYPRNLEKDIGLITDLGFTNTSIYTPEVTEIYPTPSHTKIALGDIDMRWESVVRPHFFGGVALVLSKFFHLVQPHMAFFGEKDFQQLQVIRQVVRDLLFPVEIIGVETVREPSGLAMSSRNVYLSPDERNVIAPKLYAALQSAAKEIRGGGAASAVTEHYQQQLLNAGFAAVDYLVCVDARTLAPYLHGPVPQDARLLAAARLGKVRLLDNIAVH
jgi:pantoate--beta-alanine ligase